eukprot:scaffold234666_cov35-Tisochrysis_lutea.AAC.1
MRTKTCRVAICSTRTRILVQQIHDENRQAIVLLCSLALTTLGGVTSARRGWVAMLGEGELLVVGLLCVASALPALLYMKRRQDAALEAELQRIKERKAETTSPNSRIEAVAVPDTEHKTKEGKGPAGSTRTPRPKGVRSEDRPPLPGGAKCWYDPGKGQEQVEVTIVQMHTDVEGAFYTVRLPDGSEKQTTRAKLDSQEERADAIAAALLEEEEREAKRSKQKGGSGREKKKEGGREKKRK